MVRACPGLTRGPREEVAPLISLAPSTLLHPMPLSQPLALSLKGSFLPSQGAAFKPEARPARRTRLLGTRDVGWGPTLPRSLTPNACHYRGQVGSPAPHSHPGRNI